VSEGPPTITYGDEADEFGAATFARVCPTCGRYLTPDPLVTFDGRGQPRGETATCSRCGRVAMPFVGYL